MFVHGIHVDTSFYNNAKTIRNTQMPAESMDIYPAWHTLEIEQKLSDINKKAAHCVAQFFKLKGVFL